MHTVDISIGPYANIYASEQGNKRIQRSGLRMSEGAKRARMIKKNCWLKKHSMKKRKTSCMDLALQINHKYNGFNLKCFQNFKYVFLKTIFFKLVATISQKLLGQSSWIFTNIFNTHVTLVSTRITLIHFFPLSYGPNLTKKIVKIRNIIFECPPF